MNRIIKSVSIRISNLSVNRRIFNNHALLYNTALRNSCFDKNIYYIPNTIFKNRLDKLFPDIEKLSTNTLLWNAIYEQFRHRYRNS